MLLPSYRSFRNSLVLAGLLAALVGCEKKSGLQPVTGEVHFRGQPLASGTIQFVPATGPAGPAGGALIVAGKYELPGEHGLLPGSYTVRINSPEPDPNDKSSFPATKERIPATYNTQSTATVEVRADGPNRFDFTID